MNEQPVTYTVPLTFGYDSQARKDLPVLKVVFGYFAAAMAGLTRHAVRSNEKHNKGEPVHWARGKSMDHAECTLRHLVDAEEIRAWLRRNPNHAQREEVLTMLEHELDARVWRASADAQEFYEEFRGAPLSFSSKLPEVALAPFCAGTNCRATAANLEHSPECVADHARSSGQTVEPAPVLDYSHEIPLTPPAQCKAQRLDARTGTVEFCSLPEDHEGDHEGPFGSWRAVAFPQEQADAAADDIVRQIVCNTLGLSASPRAVPLHGPAGADWRVPNVQWPRG